MTNQALSQQNPELCNKIFNSEDFQFRLTGLYQKLENMPNAENAIEYILRQIWHYKNQVLMIDTAGLNLPEYRIMLYDILEPELAKRKKLLEEEKFATLTTMPETDRPNITQSGFGIASADSTIPSVNLISCSASAEQITNYFMLLVMFGFMKETDIKEFLYNSFAVFGNPHPVQKKYPINLKNKRVLIYLVYRFYFEFDTAGSKNDYANLIKNSFDEFNNTSLLTITSNMSKKPSKKYVTPIEEYFKKQRS